MATAPLPTEVGPEDGINVTSVPLPPSEEITNWVPE
jgi:hypothetical protein